ncbi:hypothetical protein LWC05_16840, partial [Acetobacter sicerae]|nr:hypothetical protein [Acetobacter sicerae]
KPITHINGIPKTEVAPGVREKAQVKQIGELLDKRAGSVEAGTLPDAVMKELGAADDSVVLDHDTIGKQGLHHGEIEREEYEAIPAMIAQPVAVVPAKPGAAGPAVILIGRNGRAFYRLVIGRLKSVTKLKSFHAIRESEVRRLMRRGVITDDAIKTENGEE